MTLGSNNQNVSALGFCDLITNIHMHLLPVLFSFAFLFFFGNSFGQLPVTFTPGAPPTFTYAPHMIKFSKKEHFSAKKDYEIRVVLQNDSVIVDAGRFDTTMSRQTVTFKNRVITPNETKEIVFPIEEGDFLKGIPKDSCWLFKTTAGAINAYATSPQIDSKNIVAIQKLRGEIMPFSKELLMEWLKLDEYAVKLAEKGKYLEAIKKYNE